MALGKQPVLVGQGPIALAVGAGGDASTFFLSSYLFFVYHSLCGRYRLKYCLKGALNQTSN